MSECLICGCTDRQACVTDDGPCYWIIERGGVGVCSTCAALVAAGATAAELGIYQAALDAATAMLCGDCAGEEEAPPVVEVFSDHEATLFINARRKGLV